MNEKELREIELMLFVWAIQNCKRRSEVYILMLALPALIKYRIRIYPN